MLNEMWDKWGDRITDRVMRGKVERTYHLNVGNALCKLGSFKPALECYKTCLAIASEFGDVGDEKAARDNLVRAGNSRALGPPPAGAGGAASSSLRTAVPLSPPLAQARAEYEVRVDAGSRAAREYSKLPRQLGDALLRAVRSARDEADAIRNCEALVGPDSSSRDGAPDGCDT